MSKASRKRKQLYGFNEQAKAHGGLLDLYLVHRRELYAWIGAAAFNLKAFGIVNAMSIMFERWELDAAGLKCIICSRSAEQLEDVEAFGFLIPHDASKGDAMALPLCNACADHSDLNQRILAALKRFAWPEIRVAPPIHTQAGHA
jgi:hypothetical protein